MDDSHPLPSVPKPDKKTSVPQPDPESQDIMAAEHSKGKIPMDDMREKVSYSHAVGRKESLDSKKSAQPHEHPLPEEDEAEKMGFTTVDRSDAMPPVPPRKYTLAPTGKEPTVEEEPEEMQDVEARGRKRSKSKSQGDYDKESYARRQESAEPEVDKEARMRRYIEQLHRKIGTLSTERQIAEEKAEAATARIVEMKHFVNSNMSDLEKDTEALARDADTLRKENSFVKEQLRDAQSHIFSLQPYRKDLTPEEVGREYDALVELVQDWVQKFMEPFVDDYEVGVTEIMTMARKRPIEAARFKKTLKQYPDLVNGSGYPETDEDIVVAVIMRYLHDHIFQKILYGEVQNYTQMISFLENNMQSVVEPKRDLFSVRTWTAEAYNALLSAREFRSVRDRRRQDLTMELANVLKIFCKRDKFPWFYENFEANCIVPAMELYEKMQVSTHHFYLDVNPYIVWGPGGELSTSQEFVESLGKLDCKNILQNRKAFVLAKLDPPPSKKELYHHMSNICTVVPALFMRQIGQKDSIKEPMVVRKQQMLVAWGGEEKRQKFLEGGDRPLVSHIYFSTGKNDRQDRSWPSFRWA